MVTQNINPGMTQIVRSAIQYHIKLIQHHSDKRISKFPSYNESQQLFKMVDDSAKSKHTATFTHTQLRGLIYCVMELSANPVFAHPEKVQKDKNIAKPDKEYFQAMNDRYKSALGNAYNTLINVFSSTMSKAHKAIAVKYFHKHGMNPTSWAKVLKL